MIFPPNYKLVKTLKRLALICVSVLALGAGALHAEPYFIHKDGAMVLDKATGLVWMRCSVGQTWNGYFCAGEARKLTFDSTQAAAKSQVAVGGFSDWQVPTINQLIKLFNNSYLPKEVFPYPDQADPKLYWSSTPSDHAVNHRFARFIDFGGDARGGLPRTVGTYVRLVHSNQSLSEETISEFSPLVTALQKEHLLRTEALAVEKQRLEAAEKIAREQREAKERTERQQQEVERLRQEAADKAERQREEAAWRKLVASGAQNMYLQAGKEQKNGNFSQAEKIYEAIMDKYASSPFAVKASDQLTAMGRSERQASASRAAATANERAAEAQRNADRNSSDRAACFSRVNSCTASCRAAQMSSGAIAQCVSNCQRSCN